MTSSGDLFFSKNDLHAPDTEYNERLCSPKPAVPFRQDRLSFKSPSLVKNEGLASIAF